MQLPNARPPDPVGGERIGPDWIPVNDLDGITPLGEEHSEGGTGTPCTDDDDVPKFICRN